MPDVTEIYYRHHASVGATIIAIVDNYIALGLQSSDVEQFEDAKEQADNHSWVPQEYVFGVFDLCRTRQDALDIIALLGEHFEKPAYLKYDVSYSSIASKPKPEISPKESTATSAHHGSKPTTPQSPQGDSIRTHVVTRPASFHDTRNSTSAELAVTRNHSFTTAAAAFRKGKSNPLYRQVGAYYAERTRELASIQRQAMTAEAEQLVDARSTDSMIDLHGVLVADGVNIARDRVSRWWDGLGEDRARKARDGFTVVTGVGRHSAEGRSRLRSNVFKALVADGWKIEVLTGAYRVTGRSRV